MAKRGGFPGGGMPGNMANLMKQAQKMQKQMEDATKELEEKEMTASAGGGVVEVTVSGKREVTKVKIDPEAVDPDDVEMLEDLIMAAANEAIRKIDEYSQNTMGKITGGLGGGMCKICPADGVPYPGYAGNGSGEAVKRYFGSKA